jgi:hypothetical protein
MHEGNPYGHLKVGNKVILPPNLASMVGATLLEVEGWLHELHQAGVYEIAETGEIFSKRMVRDEYLRNKRAEGGKLGGNPNLKVNLKVISMVEKEVKQKPTPSSSSSSSSSNINTPQAKPADELFDDFWKAYPKKQGKDLAKASFAKRKVSKELLFHMLLAIDQQKSTDQWKKDGGQFIPAPATWLNQGRWQDEVTSQQSTLPAYS